jgi:large subunit ribosomal protein L31e
VSSPPRLWYVQCTRNNPFFCFVRPLNEYLQGTSDVRLDPQLNKKVWESGIKGVPFRLRVRISRKRNDEEGAKEKLYSYVQAVNVKNPKGLQTAVVEDA